jgi:hypothetical protein
MLEALKCYSEYMDNAFPSSATAYNPQIATTKTPNKAHTPEVLRFLSVIHITEFMYYDELPSSNFFSLFIPHLQKDKHSARPQVQSLILKRKKKITRQTLGFFFFFNLFCFGGSIGD